MSGVNDQVVLRAKAPGGTVTFARSGRSATWRKNDGPLLALGEAAGVAMPSGCRVGQCESCACTVLGARRPTS